METKKYGIVLLLDRGTTREAIRLSKESLPFAGERPLELGWETAIPHITLCMMMLDVRGFMKVADTVSSLLRGLVKPRHGGSFRRGSRLIKGTFTQLKAYGRPLYWAQPARNNPVLRRLHEDIVWNCAKFRSGNVSPHGELKGERLANWEEYGYPNVLNRFHPHVTLQWLADGKSDIDLPDARESWNWQSHQIAITEMDDRGAILSGQHTLTFDLGLR